MTVPLPDLDDPTPWVHHVTRRGLRATGGPGAAVAGFEDAAPVVLARPGPRHDVVHLAVREVLGLLALVGGLGGVLVAQPTRLRDPESEGVVRDSTAQLGVLVTRGRAGRDVVEVDATIHAYELDDDGSAAWTEVLELEDAGPLAELVVAALEAPAASADTRVGLVYAADRFGHGLGVAPWWRDRHLDGRLDHSQVRAVDRRRVRRARRAASQARS